MEDLKTLIKKVEEQTKVIDDIKKELKEYKRFGLFSIQNQRQILNEEKNQTRLLQELVNKDSKNKLFEEDKKED